VPIFRIQNKLVLFIHIPKTGGSSIERLLSQHGKVGFLQEDHVAWVWGKCTPQHFHSEIYRALFRQKIFDYVFAVVRHPYSRALSSYMMHKMGQAPDSMHLSREVGFSEWVFRALAVADRDPYVLDNHLRPQHEFITTNVELFRFEDGLSSVIKAVGGKLGLTLNGPLPHLKKAPDVTVRVGQQALERLREFYKADFLEFGYDDNIERFLANTPSLVWETQEVTSWSLARSQCRAQLRAVKQAIKRRAAHRVPNVFRKPWQTP
jgi:hypothetical protein